MAEYSPQELRPIAIQIYGELRHTTRGNRTLLRQIVYDAAQPWSAEKQAMFVANFPGEDIQRALAASWYLAEHIDEIESENPQVHIPKDVLTRFGFE